MEQNGMDAILASGAQDGGSSAHGGGRSPGHRRRPSLGGSALELGSHLGSAGFGPRHVAAFTGGDRGGGREAHQPFFYMHTVMLQLTYSHSLVFLPSSSRSLT